VTVRGVIGSEKQPYFQDADVIKVFHDHGYDVQVDIAGSRQIATSVDLSKYDFAFPAGVPQATKIKNDHKAKATYSPFYTPMAIASFKSIVDLLTQAGIVTNQGGAYLLDFNAYMKLVAQNKRWTDLPKNTTYQAGKSILITSTDVRTSNSAAMRPTPRAATTRLPCRSARRCRTTRQRGRISPGTARAASAHRGNGKIVRSL